MTKKHKGDAKIALTAKKVEHLTEPGIYKDITDNLYLLISKSGGKSWIFRYQKDHRRRDMGLGSVSYVSLLEARQKASELLLKPESVTPHIASPFIRKLFQNSLILKVHFRQSSLMVRNLPYYQTYFPGMDKMAGF